MSAEFNCPGIQCGFKCVESWTLDIVKSCSANSAVMFLINHGLISQSKICCGKTCLIKHKNYGSYWRCTACKNEYKAVSDLFFGKFRLHTVTLLLFAFICFFFKNKLLEALFVLFGIDCSRKAVMQITGIASGTTITKLCNLVGDYSKLWLKHDVDNMSKWRHVSMDETHLTRRKYESGHSIRKDKKDIWVILAVKLTSHPSSPGCRNEFLYPLVSSKRTIPVVLPFLEKVLDNRKGSSLSTDCFATYKSIMSRRFSLFIHNYWTQFCLRFPDVSHLTVNHSNGFKDMVTEVHNNWSESANNRMKTLLRAKFRHLMTSDLENGTNRIYFICCLINHNNTNPLQQFFFFLQKTRANHHQLKSMKSNQSSLGGL
jgi:hypothetical protein